MCIFSVSVLKKMLEKQILMCFPPGDMDGCAVILVCGPKNVGKSTFIRNLINSLLNQ